MKDTLLVISGSVAQDEYSGGYKMSADSVKSLYNVRYEKLNKLELLIYNQSEIGFKLMKQSSPTIVMENVVFVTDTKKSTRHN